MSRSRDIAEILGATEAANSGNRSLGAGVGAPVMMAGSWDIKICGMWFNSSIVQQGT